VSDCVDMHVVEFPMHSDLVRDLIIATLFTIIIVAVTKVKKFQAKVSCDDITNNY
jgi:hypothetical protein